MTPERIALLQELIRNASLDWTYNDTVYIREPVNFAPRYSAECKVFDFPVVKKIAFTLRKSNVGFFNRSGEPITPSFKIAWVEAEGYVIDAHSFDEEGDTVASDMIGCPCPKYTKER